MLGFLRAEQVRGAGACDHVRPCLPRSLSMTGPCLRSAAWPAGLPRRVDLTFNYGDRYFVVEEREKLRQSTSGGPDRKVRTSGAPAGAVVRRLASVGPEAVSPDRVRGLSAGVGKTSEMTVTRGRSHAPHGA